MKSMKLIMETFRRNIDSMTLSESETPLNSPKRRSMRDIPDLPEEILQMMKHANGDSEMILHAIHLAAGNEVDGDSLINWMTRMRIISDNFRDLTEFKEMPQSKKDIFFALLENFPNASVFKSLKDLVFYNINLEYLPDEIGAMENLKELILNANDLTELPESIADLKNLRMLDISYNKVNSLPESIGEMSSLESLYLFNNNLTELPESIFNLQNLFVLGLTGNKFTDEEVQRIKQLLPNTDVKWKGQEHI